MYKFIKPIVNPDLVNIYNNDKDNDIFVLSDYLNEDIIGMNDIYLSNKHLLNISTNIDYLYVSYNFLFKDNLYNIYGICIDKIIYNLLYIITDKKMKAQTYIELNTLDELYRIKFFKDYYSNTILDLLKTYINILSTKNASSIINKINNENMVLIKLDLVNQQFWTIQDYYINYNQKLLFDYLNSIILNLNLPKQFLEHQLKKYNPNSYIIDLFSQNNINHYSNTNINGIKKSFNINLYQVFHMLFLLNIDSFSIELIKRTELVVYNISYNKNFQLDSLLSDSDRFIDIFKTIYCHLKNNNQNFNKFPDIVSFNLINKFELIINYDNQNIYIPLFFLMILSAPLSFG